VERMFNVVGNKKTEWYEPCSFLERPETLKFKCRFYFPVGASTREFYNLSGDDPDLYDAQNCMALVEMEWVRSKKQYRLANDVMQMLDTKLASL
jgi:hypothetical protein